MDKIYLKTDGGSRGNPGPAAIGAVFYDGDSKIIHSYKKFIGTGTNNDAEYQAILEALKIVSQSQWFQKCDPQDHEISCRLDSQLVVEQLNGRYKVKQPHIMAYVEQIRRLISDYGLVVSFTHIPREQNKDADALVNEALDEVLKDK